MDTSIPARIVEIDERRAAIRAEEERLKEERLKLEERLTEQMGEEGIQSLSINGRTVYLRSEIWAAATDVSALEAYPETAQLVKPTVNGQTLSAWVRELPRDDNDHPILPPAVAEAVRVSTPIKIGSRKA